MYKIDSEQEFLSKNEEITTLKNKIEIFEKKLEFHEKKYKNLQFKYLRLLKNKKNDLFSLNENFSTANIMKKKENIFGRNDNNNLGNILFSTASRLNDENNRMKTIMDTIDINNINNNININVNNNAEFNNIHNNQKYFSPKISLINKNEDKNINDLLPILNKERNISIKKVTKKIKILEKLNERDCLKKSNNLINNKKEINKFIFTENNK